MNKKIFAVLIVFAVAVVGCAYAADTTDSSNNNTVTISEINFTIPEGFSEDVSEAVVNQSESDDGYTYVTNEKTFERGDHILEISVSKYEQNITNDMIKNSGKKVIINNVTGYLGDVGILAVFSYIKEGKLVCIVSDNKEIINEVVS